MEERLTEALRIYDRLKRGKMSWFTLEEALFLNELFTSEGAVRSSLLNRYRMNRLREIEKRCFG